MPRVSITQSCVASEYFWKVSGVQQWGALLVDNGAGCKLSRYANTNTHTNKTTISHLSYSGCLQWFESENELFQGCFSFICALYVVAIYNSRSILYLLNLYITKMAKPISTTETSMMTAVPLWPLSFLSTRGALKEKHRKRNSVHMQRRTKSYFHLLWI